MRALELKLPPVPLALAIGGLMWLAAGQWPALAFTLPGRIVVAAVLGVAGMAFAVAGVAAFRQAMTSFDPTRPGAASVLVSSGVYRYSRNPMYVGLLLMLGGWAAFLAHALGFLFLPAFVAYLNRFQIAPEERVLAAKFGADFAAYTEAAPRWL